MGHINNLCEFQKVCARWLPQKLTDEMKAETIRSFKENSEEVGEGVLQQIVRGDKLGVITMILRTKDSL